ncbi:MAG: TrkA family potassium uptake protein [Candidatus Marinimicrobia bacterium]|nr:TrkA family potassium uptake protein [Candidatus Neomarinimicrobiota bacterium]MCF7829654.1 TrkA family potassium uptake protein [Candidatus Neomarinimicrobiota bacterium]MCF7879814.1 TrkA family potassium uptake protein [Candidatus Neomarinimicrobiota bacterium]
MKIILSGNGSTLYFLTRTFINKGHSVTVINDRKEECDKIAQQMKVLTLHGDFTTPSILEEAGIRQADAVLAVSPYDYENLITCQLAALRFHVPRTLAVVQDPDNEEIFQQLGIDAFAVTKVVTKLIEQRTVLEEMTSIIPVGGGKVNISEVILPATAPAVGKTLHELSLPENVIIGFILREEEQLIPRGQTVLRSGDRLIVIALPDSQSEALKVLTGDAS